MQSTPSLFVRLALESKPPQDLIHQLARHRLALDPRERQQVRAEELARRLVLKLVAPWDLRSGSELRVTRRINKTKERALTMRSGISGRPFGWYSSCQVRAS